MGAAKEKMMAIEARGYGESEKYVCSGCVRDPYLQKVIRAKGQVGTCSFCKNEKGKPIRHRKTYPLESLMAKIMPAIDYYYMSTDGNIPYDGETEDYLGSFVDPYSFVYDVLADEMQVEEPELLKELFEILEPENRTTIFEFEDRTSDKDLKAWAKFTSLVNGRKNMSVGQMVSLCAAPDAPDDLKEIHSVLQVVLAHAKNLHAYTTIHTQEPLYRCVNFHKFGFVPEGYTTIPATLVGTAPAKFAENGRFNEKGDMMFYGASNPKIAVKEVGRKEDYPFTIGEFHTNKRIRVLDLSAVQSWKRPGTFSLAQEDIEKRESYLFLRQFIDRITHPVDDRKEAEEVYRPIQVFTKYLQRVGNLHGIVYRSSLADPMQRYSDYVSDRCYVLFAENRDCMDESDRQHKMNKKRLQLYMKHVYQTYDLQGQAGSKKDCGQERNEKRSIDGYLSVMDNV